MEYDEIYNVGVYGNEKRWLFSLRDKGRVHKWQLVPVPKYDKHYLRGLIKQLKLLREEIHLQSGTHSIRKFYVTIWNFNYLPRWNDLIEWKLRSNSLKFRRQILLCIGMPTPKGVLCDFGIEDLVRSLHVPRLTILSWEHNPSKEQVMFLMAKLQGTIKRNRCHLIIK